MSITLPKMGHGLEGKRIKVGRLQRIRERVRELSKEEQKGVKGGIVISIIGVLVGGGSPPPPPTQRP